MLNHPSKRRQEIRYRLERTLPATVLLRSVGSGPSGGISGILVDASNTGIGVLVQEHVALESCCVVEVEHEKIVHRFGGEVCYVKRTPKGLKLGIMLALDNEMAVLDYLANIGVEVVLPINLTAKKIS